MSRSLITAPALLLVLLVALAAPPASAATQDRSFTTHAWDATVTVNSDGTVDVTHRIDVEFPEPRRGIFLDLPAGNRILVDGVATDVPLAYTSIQVVEHPYVARHGRQVTRIRIGDPDQQVGGRVRYIVSYTVTGAVRTDTETGDQTLRVPVISHEWDGPIGSVALRINGVGAEHASCVVGLYAEQATPACTATGAADGGPGTTALALDELDSLWVTATGIPAADLTNRTATRPAPEDVDALLPGGGAGSDGDGSGPFGPEALVVVGVVALIGGGLWSSRHGLGSGGRRTGTSSYYHHDSYDSGGSFDSGGGDSGGGDSGGGGDW